MEMFPINPESLPPEIRALMEQQRQAADRANMEAADRVHRVESFVYGLDQESLFALSLLLGQLLGSKVRTAYWQGQVDGLLQDRHGVCSIHGVNHDAEILSAAREGSTVPGDKEFQTLTPGELASMTFGGPTAEGTARIIEDVIDLDSKMREYNLEWDDEKEKFFCVKCGYGYPSLEDRMLKPADTCPGCMAREGQG